MPIERVAFEAVHERLLRVREDVVHDRERGHAFHDVLFALGNFSQSKMKVECRFGLRDRFDPTAIESVVKRQLAGDAATTSVGRALVQ
mgnify:CR=1 FL=1